MEASTPDKLVHAESKDSHFPRQGWLPLALIPLAISSPTPISLPIWNLLPKLRFLQFPWRWLVALEAPMGIFFAAAVWPERPWRRKALAAVCALFFLAASSFTARTFFQACDDEDAVPGMLNVYRSGAGVVGTDEYAPPGSDSSLLATSRMGRAVGVHTVPLSSSRR